MQALFVKDALKSIGYVALLVAATVAMGPWYVVSFVAFVAFMCLIDDAFDERRSGKHYLANVVFFVVTLAAALYLPMMWFMLVSAVSVIGLVVYRK